MRVAHSSRMEFDSWPSMRGEYALHKTLLMGNRGDPANFEFGLTTFKGEGNGSPRHRHVFDQFRYAIKGEVEYGPGQVIPEGCLAYFPEGAPYGPFKINPKSVLISFQFGGPSGQGFVYRHDLDDAKQILAKTGRFEKGIYHYIDAQGREQKEDSHKAAWRQATGSDQVRLPEPRHPAPLLMYPERYRWIEIAPSVSEKVLGVFNERHTCAKMLRIAPGGSHHAIAAMQANIFFVTDGALTLEKSEACEPHDAFYLEKGERARISSADGCTLLIFGLPTFDAGH